MSRIPDDDPKPLVHALVAWLHPDGTYRIAGSRLGHEDFEHGAIPMTLEEAARFSAYGWEVLPDYFELEELTRWEQRQRARKKQKDWQW
jgi:hypothetical protein